MDAFRIILIVSGVLILLGIYIFDSKKKIKLYFKKLKLAGYLNKQDIDGQQYIQEPVINEDSELLKQMDGVIADTYLKDDPHVTIDTQFQVKVDDGYTVPVGEEMVVVLFIIAHSDHYFTGFDIDSNCKSNGYVFSEGNIYEQHSNDEQSQQIVAKIVNSFEPGTFNPDTNNFDTKAITVLMFLKNPALAMSVFDEIVLQSKNIANNLGGDLCDESRSVLTPQTINHIKEKIKLFQFKFKMSKAKKHQN